MKENLPNFSKILKIYQKNVIKILEKYQKTFKYFTHSKTMKKICENLKEIVVELQENVVL